MIHVLNRHPDSRSEAVHRIDVAVERRGGTLMLTYRVAGGGAGLKLPPASPSVRTDELWRHTCFELFVRGATGEAYGEFNFSPSTAWAAYRFSGYRAGMTASEGAVAPILNMRADDRGVTLQVKVDAAAHAQLPADATWRLGLCAVIEETNGQISYWALKHPPGKPDFHHADCFALGLPPAFRA